MPIVYNLIERSKKKVRIRIFLILSSFILSFPFSIMIYLFPDQEDTIGKIFGFPMIGCVIAAVYASFFMDNFKFIGDIVFAEKYIQIKEHLIDTLTIESITVEANSYRGEPASKGPSFNGGGDNKIRIILKNGIHYDYFILADFLKEIEQLKRVMLFYSNTGVQVIYHYKGQRIL